MDTFGTPFAFPLLADTTESISAMHVWSLFLPGWLHPGVETGGEEKQNGQEVGDTRLADRPLQEARLACQKFAVRSGL